MIHTELDHNPYPHTIIQGADWNEMFAIGYSVNNWPDLFDWTATYVVFPNLDPSEAPVIKLGTSAGMDITYNDGTESTTTTGGITLGLSGEEVVITTTTATVAKDATVIALANTTGVQAGRTIAVWLDDDSIHIDTVRSIAGSNVTLSAGISDAATSGNIVKVYDERWMVTNILLNISDSTTQNFTNWGKGLYRFDLIDPFGHTQRTVSGTCCLDRGYGHG